MIYAHQIRDVVAQYLSKSADADSFVLKFSALSYNVHREGDSDAVRLADHVESLLADARCGCISESQLRSSLKDLICANEELPKSQIKAC